MTYSINKESLSDKVYALVKHQILSGELTGGMVISEEQLAQQFGVSRTPIREAIRRLSEYGLVIIKPRSHAMVYKVDEKEVKDIAKVRLALEELTIKSLTKEAVEQHIESLSRLAADCQYYMSIVNRAEVFVKDSEFHLELVKCTGNSALYDVYERLDAKVQLLRIAQNLDNTNLPKIIAQHITIIEALRNGDTESGLSLMREHINHSYLAQDQYR